MSTETNETGRVPPNVDAGAGAGGAPLAQVASPATESPTKDASLRAAETDKTNETSTPVVSGGVRRLGRSLPTVLVFAVLLGIGYWGHHHGWSIPKFSELTSGAPVDEVEWCEEHGVPEAECISCNASLMPKGKLFGWCKEHGVHECVFHHPELAQLEEIPSVTQADMDRAARAIALRPRTKNDPACKMHLRRIQFPSKAAVDKAGIDINLVDRGPVVETVSATGEVVYDPTRVARLSSRAPGTAWRVEKKIGDHVRRGDVLTLIDAVDVGQAKAGLLQAVAQLDLQTKTYERLAQLSSGVVAGRRVLEAETARAEAEVAVQQAIQTLANFGMPLTYDEVRQMPLGQLKQQIQFLGLPSSIIEQIDPVHTTSNLIPVLAPRDGLIVQRDVVAGEVIETTKTLFTIADTSQMWLMLNVPLEETEHIAVGQKVVFHPDGGNHADTGQLTWMSTEVDAETRTVLVRAELPNEDGHLRNETFGAGEIVLREEEDTIIVPSSAVHWEGCCHVVFVRDKDFMKKGSYKVFHTRSVRPGVTTADNTEVIAGLWPGEVIVTEGSGILRAELLKGDLGAG
ncbi:MAG: efflux RND transporter periplasmic adaptor subunit [Planctomycetota bacterium]|nr:MAG: efflux RND transporter periplasmic adaptor subunit [Planctomycetota bacterium]REJ88760.1 MAG: efflux RND transporter periplasmic adaptor subunit [Planctomycetota bacterium]REK24978.1 MAG: efflux RND transporter periplasmic adaptor subunit [Planctomycetota bacterium]REK46102.1 MAG: efflux RND transporter periplasmic adaptor subunit [Planctomycetota bacterium]